MEPCFKDDLEESDSTILKNARLLTNKIEKSLTPQPYSCFFGETSLKELALKFAREFYNLNKNKKATFRTVRGNNMKIKYESEKGFKISKGNAYDLNIINFYKTTLRFSGRDINTFRFGTPVNRNPKNQIEAVMRKLKYKSSKKTRIIYISLISDCNGMACSLFSKTSNKKIYNSRIKEPEIVREEHRLLDNNPMFAPIFLQVSGVNTESTIIRNITQNIAGLKHSNVPENKLYDWIQEDLGHEYDVPNFDLDTRHPEKLFKIIVDIAVIYFDLNLYSDSDYRLAIHCKSGKDRTSLVDSIIKATHEYMFNNSQNYDNQRLFNNSQNYDLEIDYDIIKSRVSFWILFGLVISNHSTGGFGLKLDSIPMAKYIFNRNELSYLRGFSNRF